MQHAHVIIPTPHPQERYVPMSYEEYRAMEHPTGSLVEWVDGVAIFHMPPTIAHQDIAGFCYTLLHFYISFYELGFVGLSPMEMYHLPGYASREPDLLVILEKHRSRITETQIVGPADIVFEIVSPSSVQRDCHEKLKEYALSGVQEYWILDSRPDVQKVLLYVDPGLDNHTYSQVQPDSSGQYHSTCLPGFWLDPLWLWQKPMPDLLEIARKIDPLILGNKKMFHLAKKKGLELGRAEGSAMGRITIARSMLNDGMSPSMIAKYTGLSLEEIVTLANQNT